MIPFLAFETMGENTTVAPLQERFLNHLRKHKVRISMFLVNGVKLQGIVSSFDTFCVMLSEGERRQLVYKHAVSTIAPLDPLPRMDELEG